MGWGPLQRDVLAKKMAAQGHEVQDQAGRELQAAMDDLEARTAARDEEVAALQAKIASLTADVSTQEVKVATEKGCLRRTDS